MIGLTNHQSPFSMARITSISTLIAALVILSVIIIRPIQGFVPRKVQSPRSDTGTLHLFQSVPPSPLNYIDNPIDNPIDSQTGIIIPGKHKWLGGAVDSKGRIYGVPSNAEHVICLSPPNAADTDTDTDNDTNDTEQQYEMHTIPLPPSIAKGQFKWLRGIIWKDYLYGIPAWSQDGILRVDIASFWKDKDNNSSSNINTTNHDTESLYATAIPLPEGALPNKNTDSINTNRWLWHGASLNKNQTAIYAIPSNAHHVLKLDLLTQTTSLLSIPYRQTPSDQTNKWYGGILGDDNAIYGVPYAASGVLRIDAETDEVQLIGEEEFGVKEYNWHGGIKSGKNGRIYCFPAHHSHVLSIDTRLRSKEKDSDVDVQADDSEISGMDRLELLPIHRAPYDEDKVTRYKWLGGSMGLDENVYGMPSDASSVLR